MSSTPFMSFNPVQRYDRLDALRGVAVVWMTLFHFCFDLNFFYALNWHFNTDALWTVQRSGIVSLFIFCAGCGQAIACMQSVSWQRFLRRWSQVLVCALFVSAATWWFFRQEMIYFGVLHALAVMLLLARWCASWGRGGLVAGAILAVLIPQVWWLWQPQGEWVTWLNSKAWNWMGLITHKPFTQDYVPLLPWLGVFWAGMACGQWVLQHRPQWLTQALPAHTTSKTLKWLGQHSLMWYMLHQPVLYAIFLTIGGRSAWSRIMGG